MEEVLKKKTKIGVVWNTLEKYIVQIFSFVSGIVLARLLTPDDYGIVGLLTIFITFSNVFVESGFSRGLIQDINRTEEDFSTILIFNVIIGIIIYGILFFCSPLIAGFYKRPELTSLSRVLFIVIILNSFTIVQSAKLQIAIDFKKIGIINILATLISSIVGILCAFRGFSYWSLVIQTLMFNLILVILYWFMGKWIPVTGFSYKSLKKLFKYGANLLLCGFLATLLSSIQSIVIGKKYTPELLGYYSRALQFPMLISGTVTSILGNVTFPMMSQLQNNNEELINAFKKIIRLTALLIFPSMIGLALISKTLITVLLSSKWIASADYLFWVSIAYIFSPLEIINLTLLNAIGRSDLNLKLDLAKIPLIIICMVITLPLGLKIFVITSTCFSFLYYLIDGIVAYKTFNFGPVKQLFIAWKYIVATIVMAVVLIIFNNLFVSENVIKLILQLLIAVVIYALMLFILKDEEFKIVLSKIKRTIGKEIRK